MVGRRLVEGWRKEHIGAASEIDARGRLVLAFAFCSFQLRREYVSVEKLGVGEGGRVIVCARGTAANAPSTASNSPNTARPSCQCASWGKSETVTKGEPRTVFNNLLNRGVSWNPKGVCAASWMTTGSPSIAANFRDAAGEWLKAQKSVGGVWRRKERASCPNRCGQDDHSTLSRAPAPSARGNLRLPTLRHTDPGDPSLGEALHCEWKGQSFQLYCFAQKLVSRLWILLRITCFIDRTRRNQCATFQGTGAGIDWRVVVRGPRAPLVLPVKTSLTLSHHGSQTGWSART